MAEPAPINEDQLRWLIDRLYVWLRTVSKEKGERPDLNNTANITKSCLLYRLTVEAKEPLPHPPPRSYSAPWYQLIEDEIGSAYEVWDNDDERRGHVGIVINQDDGWRLVERVTDDHLVVEYDHWGHWHLWYRRNPGLGEPAATLTRSWQAPPAPTPEEEVRASGLIVPRSSGTDG